jgi:hypothetical protein
MHPDGESIGPAICGKWESGMLGMIQIMIYLLGAYLVFKGVEIFQIGLMSNSPKKRTGIIIGVCAIVVSIGVAGFFVHMADEQASSVSDGMKHHESP